MGVILADDRKHASWLPWAVVLAAVSVIYVGVSLYQRAQSSDGARIGVVVKLSYKGRFSKSWEGDLMLGGLQSGQPWSFSLDPDDARTPELARILQNAQVTQTPVSISYRQRFIVPWKTETNYLVQQVKLITRLPQGVTAAP